jgi:hypothetical protein
VGVPGEQVERGDEVRHAGVGEDDRQPRVRGQHVGEDVETGVGAAAWAVAAVHDRGDAGLGEQAPGGAQQRLARVEAADLHVRLDDPRPASTAAPR